MPDRRLHLALLDAGSAGADQWHFVISMGLLHILPCLQPDAAGEDCCSAAVMIEVTAPEACQSITVLHAQLRCCRTGSQRAS